MELIDDHPVVSHRVRFKNRAEIPTDRAGLVRDDMVVLWLVRARSQPPQYYPVTKDADERYRFNIQNVESAIPLDGAMRDSAAVYMEHGADGQGYIAFEAPAYLEGSLFDYAAQHQVDQIAKFIATHDVHQIEGESPAETVIRLLSAIVDAVEEDLEADAEPGPNGEPMTVVDGYQVEDDIVPSYDRFADVDDRFEEDDGRIRLGSVYVHETETQRLLRERFE